MPFAKFEAILPRYSTIVFQPGFQPGTQPKRATAALWKIRKSLWTKISHRAS